jgi:hypothetical protein
VQQTENVPLALLKHPWLPSCARPEVEGWRASGAGRAKDSFSGLVHITREIIALSATFMLIAAMNPCPCG